MQDMPHLKETVQSMKVSDCKMQYAICNMQDTNTEFFHMMSVSTDYFGGYRNDHKFGNWKLFWKNGGVYEGEYVHEIRSGNVTQWLSYY